MFNTSVNLHDISQNVLFNVRFDLLIDFFFIVGALCPDFHSKTMQSIFVTLLHESHTSQTLIGIIKTGNVTGDTIEHEGLPDLLESWTINILTELYSELTL